MCLCLEAVGHELPQVKPAPERNSTYAKHEQQATRKADASARQCRRALAWTMTAETGITDDSGRHDDKMTASTGAAEAEAR